MHKRVLGLLLAIIFMFGLIDAAFAEELETLIPTETQVVDSPEEAPAEEVPEETAMEETPEEGPVAFYLDGQPVTGVPVMEVEGTTYVCLPLAATAIRPDASYAWEDDRVVVRGEDFVLSAKWDNLYIECNGRYLYVPHGVKSDVYGEYGDTFVPVRTLAKALGVRVEWDGAVQLYSEGAAALESGDSYYSPQDVDLLARVIYHESGNQSVAGQIAVGNVILNRVASPRFPNTIYDVIYAPGQFPGATSLTPDAEAVLVAKLCLDGAVVLDDAYWFNTTSCSSWASRNKALVAVIGGHAFYAL